MLQDSRRIDVIRFYQLGKDCIEDAGFLYENKKNQSFSILLIHGIELVLKSYILLEDENIKVEDLKKRPFGHECQKLLDKSKKLGFENIFPKEAVEVLEFLFGYYSNDSIEVRYRTKTGLKLFPPRYF